VERMTSLDDHAILCLGDRYPHQAQIFGDGGDAVGFLHAEFPGILDNRGALARAPATASTGSSSMTLGISAPPMMVPWRVPPRPLGRCHNPNGSHGFGGVFVNRSDSILAPMR